MSDKKSDTILVYFDDPPPEDQPVKRSWTTDMSMILDADGVEVGDIWSGSELEDFERDVLVARFIVSCINAAQSFETVEALLGAQIVLGREEGSGGS